ncbi:MAG: ATP-grasp domain-containing protein, partial [bacterium]
ISQQLVDEGVNILGTPVKSITRAEDREQFAQMLDKLNLRQTQNEITINLTDAKIKAGIIGYPVLMRPSFVLGGAKMEVIYDEPMLIRYWKELLQYCATADVLINKERPILIDKFLKDAIEIDVDAICDGKAVYVAGIMEHIEEAGVHSGDSSCALPPFSLPEELIEELIESTEKLALELGVIGLMNIQYAVKDSEIYVLEVNPRASRTVPFVSKVTSVPVAKMATMVILGKTLKELGLGRQPKLDHFAVKASVFPWTRFPGTDTVLGPEMKSTGEVMGIGSSFEMAFAKSQLGAGIILPLSGSVFISVKPDDQRYVVEIAKELYEMGFHIIGTDGTARVLLESKIPVQIVKKIYENEPPNIIDFMNDGKVQLLINSKGEQTPKADEISIRRNAVLRNIPLITTMAGAKATIKAIREMKSTDEISVTALQDFHKAIKLFGV